MASTSISMPCRTASQNNRSFSDTFLSGCRWLCFHRRRANLYHNPVLAVWARCPQFVAITPDTDGNSLETVWASKYHAFTSLGPTFLRRLRIGCSSRFPQVSHSYTMACLSSITTTITPPHFSHVFISRPHLKWRTFWSIRFSHFSALACFHYLYR